MKQFYISPGGAGRQGPLEEETVRKSCAEGAFPPGTLAWTEGMDDWLPVEEVFPGCPRPFPVPGRNGAYGNPFAALKSACRHITFQGRAPRAEFWMAMAGFACLFAGLLVCLFGLFFLFGICMMCGDMEERAAILAASAAVLYILLKMAVPLAFLAALPLVFRRLHDTGRSGWRLLWLFFPLLGPFLLLMFLCEDSRAGANKYGPSAKYPD